MTYDGFAKNMLKLIILIKNRFFYRYSEEVFSQHSRRHSNDTNSDLSEDEMFLQDGEDIKLINKRRTSKTGEILASPTHRKMTPTNIRSAGSSPSKKFLKDSHSSDSKSLDSNKWQLLTAEQLHEYYKKKIEELKRSNEIAVNHLKYKLQAITNPQADDEYVSENFNFIKSPNIFIFNPFFKIVNLFDLLHTNFQIIC